MNKSDATKWLNYLIAFVWITNGLFCKVLNLVPRHEEIVARILGDDNARLWTLLIGSAEVGMAVWILSGVVTKVSAAAQIMIIFLMNTLKFTLAPDLLLWGRLNALFAFLFMLLIFYNEFYLRKRAHKFKYVRKTTKSPVLSGFFVSPHPMNF
ncbi:MAG TPA: DoxX-like family protein [Chitinophagaceae bacterium]|nr:DoxX-like family protein [Chitinophagaceae bacterium]